jgi:hypothetical protein
MNVSTTCSPEDPMDNDQLLRGLAGAAVIVLLVLVLVTRRRRAARADTDVVGDAERHGPAATAPETGTDVAASPVPATAEGIEEPAPSEPVPHQAVPPEAAPQPQELDVVPPAAPALEGTVVDPIELRSLRAQVRTLELTLELLGDEPVLPPAPAHAAPAHAAPAQGSWHTGGQTGIRDAVAAPMVADRYRRQVTATLRGLAERTGADEAPERTMARVVAAIERLESDDVVDRPVLPTVPAGTVIEAAARPAELSVAAPAPPPHVPAPSHVAGEAPTERHPAPVAAPVAPTAAPEPEMAGAAPAADLATVPTAAATADPTVSFEPVHRLPVPVDAGPVAPVPFETARPVTPIGGGHRRATRWSRRSAGHSTRSGS